MSNDFLMALSLVGELIADKKREEGNQKAAESIKYVMGDYIERVSSDTTNATK